MIGDAQLRRLMDIASELGNGRLRADAAAVAERVAEGRFYVACIGQFKRGKSTLLNALVGREVLPAGIVPVTAVPTVLRHDAGLGIAVRFTNGSVTRGDIGELESYVSEERNPENAKAVELVEVFVPSPLLEHGMCLVDTPGIGSVFATNTATTHQFIPHIDAALVVVGVDPPISGDELDLVEQVGRSVRNMIVVLNKADRFTDSERDAAVAFTTRALTQRLHRPIGTVHAVSALERLAPNPEERDWPALVAELQALRTDARESIVGEAARRGIARIAAACRHEIELALRALREPLEQSDRRVAALQSYIGTAEYQLPRLGALIHIEHQQIGRLLSSRRDAFLTETTPAAATELRTRIPGRLNEGTASLREQAFGLARHIAQDCLAPWFRSEEKFAEDLYRETTARFVELVNGFLAGVRETAAEGAHRSGESHEADHGGLDPELAQALSAATAARESEHGFRTASRFYFHDVESLVRATSPLPRLTDLLRPRAATVRDVERRAVWYLEQLLQINTTRVRNDVDERIIDSGRRLEAELRSVLRDVLASAERSLERARVVRAQGSERVTTEIHRLESLLLQLDELDYRVATEPHRPRAADT